MIMRIVEEYKSLDNRGALLIPSSLKITDEEYKHYRELDMDFSACSVNKMDLPDEFSDRACKLVDVFRRKTVNLAYECLLYFDYKTAEILYCFIGLENNVGGEIHEENFEGRNVASIHNHPETYYSAPSYENFQILDIANEDFEIICGFDEFWILEAKGLFDPEIRAFIHREAMIFYNQVFEYCEFKGFTDWKYGNQMYGEFMENYINDIDIYNIKLVKKEYR